MDETGQTHLRGNKRLGKSNAGASNPIDRANDALSFYAALITIALCCVYYLIQAYKFLMPYGYDEIITMWPVGRALAESSPAHFLRLLIAGFLSEDHLFPVSNLTAYLLYSKDANPVVAIGTATKLLYFVALTSSALLVHSLQKKQQTTVIAVLLLVVNQSLMWNHLTYSIDFNLVIILSVLSLYSLLKYLTTDAPRYLVLTLLTLSVGSFVLESFFATLPVLLLFSLWSVSRSDKTTLHKVCTIAQVAGVMLVSLIPYCLIHYRLYGTVLPGSRLAIVGDGDRLKNSILVAVQLLNDWAFGMPRFLFDRFGKYSLVPFGVGVLFLFAAIKQNRLLRSSTGVGLLVSLVLSMPVVMYTGRYHPGLWTFSGIVFLIVLSEVVSNALDALFHSARGRNLGISALALLFVAANGVTQPSRRMRDSYRRISESSVAAYLAIDSPVDKMAVVRLPGAEELMHPIAFWLGNKIYNGEAGLVYYSDYGTMRMKNMQVENYDNDDKKTFEHFAKFADEYSADGSVVLFKSRNQFFRFAKDVSKRKVYRAAVIPGSPQDMLEIHPPIASGNRSAGSLLRIDLILSRPLSQTDRIVYGSTVQRNLQVNGNQISIFTYDVSSPNSIRVISTGSSREEIVRTIEAYFPADSLADSAIQEVASNAVPSIAANLKSCQFHFTASAPAQIDLYATIERKRSIPVRTLYPADELWAHLKVEYWSIDLNKEQRVHRKIEPGRSDLRDGSVIWCN